LGGVVGGVHTVLVHEGEEMRIVHEERRRQVPDVLVGGVQIPLAERKEPLLDRQCLVDQLRAREGCAASAGIATEAMPGPAAGWRGIASLRMTGQGIPRSC